jgi:hypothetical protein
VQRVTVTLRQMEQTNQAGRALDERADRGALVLANDQIALLTFQRG